MRIAVCDYSATAAARIRYLIEQYCALYDLKPEEIRCFTSPEQFQLCTDHFTIVYMGFGGGVGFAAAWQLRQRDRICRIILVDDTQEYAVRGVRIHCADYIIRPVEFRHIVQSMRLAMGGTRI